MNKKDALMLIPYGVPWIFLTLYADMTWGIAWQYGVVLAILAVGAGILADNSRLLVLGNLLSVGVSLLMVRLFGFDAMHSYFEPFGAFGWVALLTAVSGVMQMLVWKKNQSSDR